MLSDTSKANICSMDCGIKNGGGHVFGTCPTYFMTHWDSLRKHGGVPILWVTSVST